MSSTMQWASRRFIRAIGDELPPGNYRHLFVDWDLFDIARRAGVTR